MLRVFCVGGSLFRSNDAPPYARMRTHPEGCGDAKASSWGGCAGGPRPIERVFRTVPEDGGLCCWNTCVLTVLWITGKLDVGATPTDTTGQTNWMCALAGGCWQAFEARYQGL
ncbi:hypothetical protein IFM61606_03575 [Aspergillus udagawae]|nr:hypothetical protein IFM61606_03575 [Aspergillus udagawae]